MSIASDLMDQVASLTAQLNAANARIAHLLTLVALNPREITKDALRARLFTYIDKAKLFDLISENNTTEIRRVAKAIKDRNGNQPVGLDSQPIQKLLDDFVTLELLTAQQITIIKRDATAQEAFV